MSPSSPPTRRVVDVIEFLIERHGTPTRLSDIVHALGLNQATAHLILKELTESGWITRDPVGKTFSVGGTLVRLAGQINDFPSITRSAHAAAADAATVTGYSASVSERVADELVIIAFIAADDGHWTAAAGDRLPFAAPFGPAFAAWEPAEERGAWVRRSGVSSRAFEAQLAEQLEDIRTQGFSVERLSAEIASAIPVMLKMHTETRSDSMRNHVDQVLLEMTGTPRTSTKSDAPKNQYVGAIAAPIFNRIGRVTHNICVHPFRALPPRSVQQIGRRLRQAADAIEPSR